MIQEHKKEQKRQGRVFGFKRTKKNRSGKKRSFVQSPQEMRWNPCWFHPCQLGAQSISSNSTTCASIPLPLQPELLCPTNLIKTQPNLPVEGAICFNSPKTLWLPTIKLRVDICQKINDNAISKPQIYTGTPDVQQRGVDALK